MYTLGRLRFASCAAAGALVVLAAANTSARAEDLPQRYGPVGPSDTILATFGNKQAIAFYEVDNGRCAVSAVVYDKTDAETGQDTAARVRISLEPREMVQIDSTDNETLHLECGDYAKTLAVIENNPQVASKRRTRRKG
jgi:NAD(P)-dependent dehydrogenase (short-subunit alcohol dehydrogenase family)